MNDKYRFRLTVETPDHRHECSAFDVDAFIAKEAQWDRYDLCSDSFTAAIAGGVTSLGAQHIDVEREKLAKQIAEALTAHIMAAIKARDLRNGYEQNTESREPEPSAHDRRTGTQSGSL
jgi:hypothetical protein